MSQPLKLVLQINFKYESIHPMLLINGISPEFFISYKNSCFKKMTADFSISLSIVELVHSGHKC